VTRLALVLVGCICAASTTAATEPQPPLLSVEPAQFDFGEVRQEQTLQKEFRVHNFGGSVLVISNISTSCGCTVSHIGSERLEPGQSTAMRVSVRTRKDRGDVIRKVLIESNDPEQPRLQIEVRATVVEP